MARHTGGWVKLWRKASLGDINSNFIRGGLFGALISMANIQNSKVSWKGKPRTLERGELVTSLKELAELGEVDPKTVKRHLAYLSLRETLSIETSHGGLLIKINNYEAYQGQDAEGSEVNPISVADHVRNEWIHNEELKNKRSKETKSDELFDFFKKQYLDLFPGTVAGSNASKRFATQFKTDEATKDLALALKHYSALLKAQTWRHPKQSFETFLGTKKSGFFWREFIQEPKVAATSGIPDFSDYKNEVPA